MHFSTNLFHLIRNIALCHYLNGFFLFIIGWGFGLSNAILFGITIFFYLAAILFSRKTISCFTSRALKSAFFSLGVLPRVILSLFLILNFLFCLLPPVEHIEADALLYNFTLPWQHYLRGEIGPLDWSMNDKFPLYLQMAQLPFTVLGFPWVIKAGNLFALPALLIIVWNWAQFLGYSFKEREWMISLLSALALFIKQYGAASFDIINTVYILLSFFYLVRATRENQRSDWIWGILFLGIACSLKTFLVFLSLVWIAAYFLWKTFLARRSWRPSEGLSILFLLLVAFVWMGPFLIRNWMTVGNPAFPLLTNVFGPFVEHRVHHEVIEYAQVGYGYGRSLFDFVLMPFRMILLGRKFDYWTDPILLLFLCGTFFPVRTRWRTEWGLMAVIALFLYTAFFLGSQQARYFYPFWILVLLLGARPLFQRFGKRLLKIVLIGQMAFGLVCFFFFHRDALANLKHLSTGKYLDHTSFSHVWNKALRNEEVKTLCLKMDQDMSLVDLLYFTVPIRVLGHTTSILSVSPNNIGDCNAFMIGTQWPLEAITSPQGEGRLVSEKEFLKLGEGH